MARRRRHLFLYRCPGAVVSHCLVRRYNGDGVSLQQSNDAQVLDCVSEGNASLGLHPGSGSQRPLVRGCVARGNSDDGLYLCWRGKNGVFFRNETEGMAGHRNRVEDNLIENNGVGRDAAGRARRRGGGGFSRSSEGCQ
jgi:nitrous oxidase accessory protein NosD